jgi:hypothetical protein
MRAESLAPLWRLGRPLAVRRAARVTALLRLTACRKLQARAAQRWGSGRHSMISTESPGKMVK